MKHAHIMPYMYRQDCTVLSLFSTCIYDYLIQACMPLVQAMFISKPVPKRSFHDGLLVLKTMIVKCKLVNKRMCYVNV